MPGYKEIIAGNRIVIDLKDITDGDGQPFNPPKIIFKYQAPGQAVVTVTYPDDSIEHVADGWFRFVLDTTESNLILGVWDTVAQGLTAEDVSIIVHAAKFKIISNGLN